MVIGKIENFSNQLRGIYGENLQVIALDAYGFLGQYGVLLTYTPQCILGSLYLNSLVDTNTPILDFTVSTTGGNNVIIIPNVTITDTIFVQYLY